MGKDTNSLQQRENRDKILAKKSQIQGIYKQGLLENSKKYFMF